MATVAVLGTGIMGAPMARNIAAAGHEVRVWNRTREKAEGIDGAEVRDTPGAAVDGAELVVTMLIDAGAVEEVIRQAIGAMSDDAVWLQTSTVGIAGTERLSKLAGERGVAFVDAPVLGTKEPAEQAQLVVLAAGPPDALDRAKPVFDAIGSKTVELGEVGTATRQKLVLNHWVLNLVEATAETMAFAEALALDPQAFLEGVADGPLDSQYGQMKGKLILERNFPPSFPLAGALKDVRLTLEAAERHDFDAALAEAIARKMQKAVEMGHGDEDMAATWYASKEG